MKRFLSAGIALLLLLAFSCGPAIQTMTETDISNFSKYFMVSFDQVRNNGIPVSASVHAPVANTASRATVPSSVSTFTNGTMANYPEVGLTSSWIITDASATVAANVYLVSVRTNFPSTSSIDYYLEEYYVKDITSLGVWDYDDPIVNTDGVQDQTYRVRKEVHYRDGTVRYEKIVKVLFKSDAQAGFSAFDVDGSLDYPELFYPEADPTDSAEFSEVVVYTHTRNRNPDFWFWDGAATSTIVGVRYYTEHYTDAATYAGTMVSFERTVEEYTTSGGELINQLGDVFLGSKHQVMAQSVLRQEVLFDVDNSGSTPVFTAQAGGMTTIMKSHVVNIATNYDFELTRTNSLATQLENWSGETLFVPTGDAEPIPNTDPYPDVLTKTRITNADGTSIPLNEQGPGDISVLYNALQAGVYTVDTGGQETPAADTIDGAGVLVFGGSTAQGGMQVETPPQDASINPISAGTIEAWIYVNSIVDTAGIVHKGVEPDFSDEGYTLQFWGSDGTIAFAIAQQNNYRYDLVSSGKRLNTGKWYYVVGTWDTATGKIKLYTIYKKRSGTASVDVQTASMSNCPTGPYEQSGPLIIGSQLFGTGLSGYYSFDGKIDGVKVSGTAKSQTDIVAYFNQYKDVFQ